MQLSIKARPFKLPLLPKPALAAEEPAQPARPSSRPFKLPLPATLHLPSTKGSDASSSNNGKRTTTTRSSFLAPLKSSSTAAPAASNANTSAAAAAPAELKRPAAGSSTTLLTTSKRRKLLQPAAAAAAPSVTPNSNANISDTKGGSSSDSSKAPSALPKSQHINDNNSSSTKGTEQPGMQTEQNGTAAETSAAAMTAPAEPAAAMQQQQDEVHSPEATPAAAVPCQPCAPAVGAGPPCPTAAAAAKPARQAAASTGSPAAAPAAPAAAEAPVSATAEACGGPISREPSFPAAVAPPHTEAAGDTTATGQAHETTLTGSAKLGVAAPAAVLAAEPAAAPDKLSSRSPVLSPGTIPCSSQPVVITAAAGTPPPAAAPALPPEPALGPAVDAHPPAAKKAAALPPGPTLSLAVNAQPPAATAAAAQAGQAAAKEVLLEGLPVPDLAGSSAWEQTSKRCLPGLLDLAANLPRLKPPAMGATDLTQLKQQLQQHSKGLAHSLIKQMVPKRIAVTSRTSTTAAGAAAAVAAAAARPGGGGSVSGAGAQSVPNSRPAVRGAAAACHCTGVLITLWRLLQQQEQETPLRELYRAAAAGALRSNIVTSAGALQEELQEEAWEERFAVGGAALHVSAQQAPQQQAPQQQAQQLCEAAAMMKHVDGFKVCADAVAALNPAGAAAKEAARHLSAVDAAAGVGAQAGNAGAQPCGVAADFSDCQALLAVMAAVLE